MKKSGALYTDAPDFFYALPNRLLNLKSFK